MIIDPYIVVLLEPLSPPRSLNRDDFLTVKTHLMPLNETPCDVVFKDINHWDNCDTLPFDWRNDPLPPPGEEGFGIKAVVARPMALQILRRAKPGIFPLIGQTLVALFEAGLPVGGASTQGGIKLFHSVEELNAWLVKLPLSFETNNPPAPFSPYPLTI